MVSSVALAKEDWSIMWYVYIIRSTSHPDRIYFGITDDHQRRLKEHNSGGSKHTSKWMPWEYVVVLRFADEQRAREFEKYLKTGSGNAFAKRHFL